MEGLIGLENAKRLVASLIRPGAAVHAALLYGPQGSGKSTLARELAAAWLCPTPSDDGRPCGVCNVCVASAAGRCVDMLVIEPDGPSRMIRNAAVARPKSADAEDSLLMPLGLYVRTRPLMARHKVVLIEDADRMNQSATSALMKTLEEPQSYVRFILTTSEFGILPQTIRSRCLAVACDVPPRDQASSPFAETLGDQKRIESAPGAYARLQALLAKVGTASQGAALKLADEFRSISSEVAKANDLNAREANCVTLAAMAVWARRNWSDRPAAGLAIAEAHRLIQGNGNPQLVLDGLFSAILDPDVGTPRKVKTVA